MSSCAVATCGNYFRKTKHKGIVYHAFPKSSRLSREWLRRCNRSGAVNVSQARICSEHFKKEQYEDDMKSRLLGIPEKRILKKTAVPCLLLPEDCGLEEDMDNYLQWKMMGSHIRLKKGVLPHKFECQSEALLNTPSAKKRIGRRGNQTACEARGCSNGPGRNSKGVSFHTFPKDPSLRAAWTQACGRPNFKPIARSALCANHFSEDQIDRTSPSEVRLRDNAVPNVFTGPPPPQKEKVIAAAAASEKDEINFEPEIVIKEEPIDIDEDQQPSTSKAGDEFILPSTHIPSEHTPTLGVAFSICKTEIPDEDTSDERTSNGKHKDYTRKNYQPLEQTEKRLCGNDDDSSDEVKDSPKDQYDAFGEYIAAKLRKMDWKSCAHVQKAIVDIIFEAEMGKYKT